MVKVYILSSSPVFRAGLKALLGSDEELQVGGEAGNLSELEDFPLNKGVCVVSSENLKLVEELLKQPGAAKAAVLAIGIDETVYRRLSTHGLKAWGMISHLAPAETLQASIHAIDSGLVVIEPDILQEFSDGGPLRISALDENDEAEPLTNREIEILQQITNGLANKQIAFSLGISENTVKFHISSIYSKLGVNSRTEAVRKGARLGIVAL